MCRPASPKTCTIRSDAPFTTCECDENSGGRVHEAANAKTAHDAIEITIQGRANDRHNVQGTQTSGLLTLRDIELRTEPADEAPLVLPFRQLARDIEDSAAARPLDVISPRIADGWQGDAERGEATQDDA